MMSGFLPHADLPNSVWTPVAHEIHLVIWHKFGLEKVQKHVRQWATEWMAKAKTLEAEQAFQNELHKNDVDWCADWHPLLPPLPLPPSNESQMLVIEKWVSLAAVHDVYAFNGDKVLPWPLPNDDQDLVAIAEWINGDAGAYHALLRQANELPESYSDAVRGWLQDVVAGGVKSSKATLTRKTLQAARPSTLRRFLDDAKVMERFKEWKKQYKKGSILQFGAYASITEIKQVRQRFDTRSSQGWTEKNVTAEVNRKQPRDDS